MRQLKFSNLKSLFLVLFLIVKTGLIAQVLDTCHIGIPHEKYNLIKRLDLLAIDNYRKDFKNGRFHLFKDSIISEIDRVRSEIVDNIQEIRRDGFMRLCYFELVEYEKDTLSNINNLEQNLQFLQDIKEKISSNKKLKHQESLILFRILFNNYSNVFRSSDWIQGTRFRFMSFLKYYIDSSHLIVREENTFIDTFILNKIHYDFRFGRDFDHAYLSKFNFGNDSLRYDVKNYYFPSFEEYYSEDDYCIYINQQRTNKVFEYLMNDYVLIYRIRHF